MPAGVDDAARLKAGFLDAVAKGHEKNALVSRKLATELLATMLGGFNIKPLIDLLPDAEVGAVAAEGLKKTLLMFDYFHDVKALADKGQMPPTPRPCCNPGPTPNGSPRVPRFRLRSPSTVFKVSGETNTDDLSPAPDASTRPDIPLHALAMLKNARPGIEPDEAGARGPIKQLAALIAKGHPVAYVGDVVGTGSSRKSATNSVLWFTGEDIPYVPNKRFGGVCLGTKIAPIFYNTMEDAGALPIELDVSQMETGDVIELRPYDGKALKNGEVISEFTVKSDVVFDEVRAGGRIPLIIGRGLTARAREALGLPVSTLFRLPAVPADTGKGFTARPEDGRARLPPARGQGHAPRHLLRTEDDHGRLAGHHRPDDPRRAEGSRLPRLFRRSGDAVLLPHRGLSEAGRRPDPPRSAELHLQSRRRRAASGRRRHPLLAQPPADARHRRHRRRQPHPLPDRHFLPGRLRPRRLRGGDRRHAARHAGIRAGPLQGRDAAGHHPARPRQRHSAMRRSRPAR